MIDTPLTIVQRQLLERVALDYSYHTFDWRERTALNEMARAGLLVWDTLKIRHRVTPEGRRLTSEQPIDHRGELERAIAAFVDRSHPYWYFRLDEILNKLMDRSRLAVEALQEARDRAIEKLHLRASEPLQPEDRDFICQVARHLLEVRCLEVATIIRRNENALQAMKEARP